MIYMIPTTIPPNPPWHVWSIDNWCWQNKSNIFPLVFLCYCFRCIISVNEMSSKGKKMPPGPSWAQLVTTDLPSLAVLVWNESGWVGVVFRSNQKRNNAHKLCFERPTNNLTSNIFVALVGTIRPQWGWVNPTVLRGTIPAADWWWLESLKRLRCCCLPKTPANNGRKRLRVLRRWATDTLLLTGSISLVCVCMGGSSISCFYQPATACGGPDGAKKPSESQWLCLCTVLVTASSIINGDQKWCSCLWVSSMNTIVCQEPKREDILSKQPRERGFNTNALPPFIK